MVHLLLQVSTGLRNENVVFLKVFSSPVELRSDNIALICSEKMLSFVDRRHIRNN